MCNSCHMGRYLLTHLLLLFILFHLAEYIPVSANGSANGSVTVNVSCIARLNMTDGAEWWTLTQNSRYVLSNEPPGSLEMIVYSERIAQPIFSAITGFG